MITCEAARAFGVENHQGSIEAGKQADLLIIDLERSALNPVSQIVSNIVYAGPVRVSGLIIKGQALVWEGNLCHASAGAITKEFENWYNRIWSVANIPDM
jgi:5-methylthioadenosine/S-adenosylhomocysteine deaminase